MLQYSYDNLYGMKPQLPEKARFPVKKRQTLSKTTLFLTALIWGGGFIFSQMALDTGFGPAALIFGKFSIAAVLSGVLFHKSIREHLSWRAVWRCAPVGLILAASFFTQTLGLQHSTPSNCALITTVYVVLTPFLWKLIFRRQVRKIYYLASLLCFAGVAALSFDFAGGIHFRTGDLWTLLCAVLFAAQLVATEIHIGELDYRLFLFLQFSVAAICSLAAYLLTEAATPIPLTWRGSFSIAYLGCLSTCFCYLMQTSAQRYVSSHAVALILSLEAMFGALFSVLLGYDKPSLQLLLGGAAILIAVSLPELVAQPGAGKAPPALEIEMRPKETKSGETI